MSASKNQTQQRSIQYEKIHKKKRSRKDIHHAFSNENIVQFDRNYLKINEQKRNQIREAMFTLVSQLNSLQHTEEVENKFDAIYLGGSFDSEVDLDCISDIDLSLMVHTKRKHRDIQNGWSKRLEYWFLQNKLQGEFEYVRSHCNEQFENTHRKGIAIKWKNHLPFVLNVDLLIFFRTEEILLGNDTNIPGITILPSQPYVFNPPLQFYLQTLKLAGHNYSLASRLEVYFTMGNSHFVKEQPEVVKQVIRRYKYWQKRCKAIEIEDQLHRDIESLEITRRLPSIALCYIVIHVFEKSGTNELMDPGLLWMKVLEHLKDIDTVDREEPWVINFNEFYDFSTIDKSILPKSQNPLRIIDVTRPDRDLLQALNNTKMWQIIPHEANLEYYGNRAAPSKRTTHYTYETYAETDY